MSDPIRLDVPARQAWQGDTELDLKPMEFRLLAYLVGNAGRVVTFDQLMRRVWMTDWMPNRKTIITTMMCLRRQLGDSHPFQYVKAVRGIGYRFDAAMTVPAESKVVDIDGRRYDVLLWEKHPYTGSVSTFTLHARPVEAVADVS